MLFLQVKCIKMHFKKCSKVASQLKNEEDKKLYSNRKIFFKSFFFFCNFINVVMFHCWFGSLFEFKFLFEERKKICE